MFNAQGTIRRHPPSSGGQESMNASGSWPVRSIAISVAVALALVGFGVYSYTKYAGRGSPGAGCGA